MGWKEGEICMGDGDRGVLERLPAGTWGAGLGVWVGRWWRCRLPVAPRLGAPEESAPCSQEGALLGEGRQFRA